MLKRRPLLVTPWAIWIKLRLRIPYCTIRLYVEHGEDERGRTRMQIIDEFDREYWVRLKPWHYKLFRYLQK
jgi:hypothetical protein